MVLIYVQNTSKNPFYDGNSRPPQPKREDNTFTRFIREVYYISQMFRMYTILHEWQGRPFSLEC